MNLKSTSYPAPLATHALVAPPPAIFHRSSNETMFKVPDAQHCAPKPTFKVSDPYSRITHLEPPVETEKPAKIVEQDEISLRAVFKKHARDREPDERGLQRLVLVS